MCIGEKGREFSYYGIGPALGKSHEEDYEKSRIKPVAGRSGEMKR